MRAHWQSLRFSSAAEALIMQIRFFAVATALAFLITSSLSAQSPPIKILFLGDNGHHQPSDRFRQLQPVLEKRGIELTYTDKRRRPQRQDARRATTA